MPYSRYLLADFFDLTGYSIYFMIRLDLVHEPVERFAQE